ncbi:MAG: ATP-binding protein [Bacteroidales bacterium]|nr:ATP-binding protein [Bacteroidales bacterium]MDD3891017.1 ATP-binding protein [Bacteroidales bacterium]
MDKHSILEIENRIEILKSISIFKSLDEVLLHDIANALIKKSLDKNTILFNKGDKNYALYIIVEGKVKVHDEDHTFAEFGKGQYLGEYSLVDSTPRSASVTALESTSLLGLDQKIFYNLITSRNEISIAMLKGLVLRLRDYNKLEAELTQKNIEIEHQKKELEKQRGELEALNATKDKFFAIIAHDLKNPFSTVLGLSELLAREFETFDSKSLKDFITQIYKYSNNTFNLLENLLQWSMLQTDRIPLRPTVINLKHVIEENLELLTGNAKNKNIEMQIISSNACSAYIDANQITTVVRNLISNAIKFTPNNGKIIVRVDDDGEFWRVSISDNGIGIDKKDIKKLFLIDSNPTTIGTSQEKGTGLGLILCKEFVERNGGHIWVESTHGKGSTFSFTVPKTDTIEKQ